MPLSTFFLELLLALALGTLVGLERQWHRRLLDLKTTALVSLGACLFMGVSASAAGYVDPVRMASQIVVGVGFIGGGLMWRQGPATRGVNTAATLWCSAAIGTLCGLGRLTEAALAAVLLVVANTVLRDLARRLNLNMGPTDALSEQVAFDVECDAGDVPRVRDQLLAVLAAHRADLRALSETRAPSGARQVSVVAYFDNVDIRAEIDAVLQAARLPGVAGVSWRRL
jgi:putative Mg2+ transporter-C (MgtC) family protein